jgi:hypothetical protein
MGGTLFGIGWRYNRVDRVLGFFSSRPNWDPPPSPPPHPQASVPPFGSRGGGHTRLRERGVGGPNFDEGTDTVELKV